MAEGLSIQQNQVTSLFRWHCGRCDESGPEHDGMGIMQVNAGMKAHRQSQKHQERLAAK